MFRTQLFFYLILFASSEHLPSKIRPCKKTQPDFEECLRSSAEDAMAKLANGNKELKIPKIEPLVVEKFEIERNPGPISLQHKYTNVILHGLSGLKCQKFTVDLDTYHIRIDLTIPLLTIEAKYDLKGQLLLFPVDAQGDMTAALKNFGASLNATMEKFKKDNVEYLRLVSVEFLFKPEEAKNVQFKFGTLIQGNAEMDKQVHKVIEDDPMAFFEVTKPFAQKLWATIAQDIANKFFTQVPLSELF